MSALTSWLGAAWRAVDPLRSPLSRAAGVLLDWDRTRLAGAAPGATHTVPGGDIVLGVAATAGGFWVARWALSTVLPKISDFYKNLGSQRRKRFDLYILSQVNACHIGLSSLAMVMAHTPCGSGTVLSTMCGAVGLATPDLGGPGSLSWGMMTFMFGYLLHDFHATRHEWSRYPSEALHHVAGFAICAGILQVQSPLAARYVAHYGLVELSTIFLNTMWLMREAGRDGTAVFTACKYAFALSFFATRPVYMCYNTYVLIAHEGFLQMGGGMRLALVGLLVGCALQWWWFRKIVANMLLGGGKNEGGKDGKKDE